MESMGRAKKAARSTSYTIENNMSADPESITRLLTALRSGSSEAKEELMRAIYPQLHRLARNQMQNERADHTLQPTALVNEAYLRLLGQESRDWKDRVHFMAVAATVMRQILVDYARKHRAGKRGGDLQRTDLDELRSGAEWAQEKLLALDQALSRLSVWDARQARMVELRFFGGLTEEETAEALAVSVRTVKRDWKLAKAWLYDEVGR